MKALDYNYIVNLPVGFELDQIVSDIFNEKKLKNYSSDLKKSWELLHILKKRGIHITIECLFDSFRVGWYYDEVYTKTAEEGICKIAILSSLDLKIPIV